MIRQLWGSFDNLGALITLITIQSPPMKRMQERPTNIVTIVSHTIRLRPYAPFTLSLINNIF